MEEIKQYINEELGVNDSVASEAGRIWKAISEKVKSNPPISDALIGYEWATIKTRGKEIEIPVVYRVVPFQTMADYKRASSWGGMNSSYNQATKSIYLNSGYIVSEKKLISSLNLQHELHHAFQHASGIRPNLVRDENIYRIATASLASMSLIPRAVAFVFYYYEKAETDANINNIYAAVLQAKSPEEEEKTLKSTVVYRNIKYLNDNKKDFLSDKRTELELKKYKVSPGQFKKIYDEVLKSYYRNFGRAIVKARQDRDLPVLDGVPQKPLDEM